MMIRTLKRRPAADYAWLAGGAAVGTGDGVREREREGNEKGKLSPKMQMSPLLHFTLSTRRRHDYLRRRENHPEDNRRFIRGLLI